LTVRSAFLASAPGGQSTEANAGSVLWPDVN